MNLKVRGRLRLERLRAAARHAALARRPGERDRTGDGVADAALPSTSNLWSVLARRAVAERRPPPGNLS